MTIFKFVMYIYGLILMAIVGYNSGYMNGNRDTIERFNDWRNSFYARHKETVENYERQINVLKQMLEKERGEK